MAKSADIMNYTEELAQGDIPPIPAGMVCVCRRGNTGGRIREFYSLYDPSNKAQAETIAVMRMKLERYKPNDRNGIKVPSVTRIIEASGKDWAGFPFDAKENKHNIPEGVKITKQGEKAKTEKVKENGQQG